MNFKARCKLCGECQNAVLLLQLGLPSTLIRQEKTLAFHFTLAAEYILKTKLFGNDLTKIIISFF